MKKAQEKTNTKEGTDLANDLKEVLQVDTFAFSSVSNCFCCCKSFQQFPDNLDEIDALIHEARAKAECNQATNAEVIA